MLTPDQIVDKQIKRAQQATPDYTNGVNGVTESPTVKAAAKVNDWVAGVQNAAQDGSFVNGLQAVSLADWKAATAGKAARWADGVSQSRAKLLAFQRNYGPIRQSIAAQVQAMPNSSFEDRLARMNANARALHAQPYKGNKGR